MGDGFGFIRAVGLLVTLSVAALLSLFVVQYLSGGGPDQFLLVAGLAILVVAVVGFVLANHVTDG